MEKPESLPTSGVMMSPNFPGNYTNHLHERKTIEVAKGSVINIHFTDFELESPGFDYVQITDGDGTFLGLFWSKDSRLARHHSFPGRARGGCKDGEISDITSVTETVHVLFHTDMRGTRSGWRLEWSKWRFFT